MNNISKALLLAGSMLLFVFGFSYSMYLINKLYSTSNTVLQTITTTKYYDNIEVSDDATKTRTVGIDTVISTLYRYYKESYSVEILNEKGDLIQLFDTTIESKLNSSNDLKNSIYNNSGEKAYMFGAPWSGSNEQQMNRINYFLNGTKGYINNILVDYSEDGIAFKGKDGGLIGNYGNSSFIESFVEYSYSGETISTDDGLETITGSTKELNKIIITYQIKN